MSSRVRIKMCGMTRAEDIAAAVALGVDALGFIFYAPSQRNISIAHAKKLIQDVPPLVSCVAVLVNPDVEFVDQVLTALPIHCLQFHGDESPSFCGQFKTPYIKAIPAIDREQINRQTSDYGDACAFLLDTPASGRYGGTGQTFDWTMVPTQMTKPIILAGGLNSANVQHAVTVLQPYAVDVCSGVEERPGIKDHRKMNEFVSILSMCSQGGKGEKNKITG